MIPVSVENRFVLMTITRKVGVIRRPNLVNLSGDTYLVNKRNQRRKGSCCA